MGTHTGRGERVSRGCSLIEHICALSSVCTSVCGVSTPGNVLCDLQSWPDLAFKGEAVAPDQTELRSSGGNKTPTRCYLVDLEHVIPWKVKETTDLKFPARSPKSQWCLLPAEFRV